MKLISVTNLIFPLVISSSISSVTPSITGQNKLIGPVEAYNGVSTFAIYFPAENNNFKFQVSLCNINDTYTYYVGNEYYTYYYPATKLAEADFSLPFYKYLSNSGLLIKIDISYKDSGKTYISSSKVIYPASKREINTLAYQNDLYIRPNLVIDFSNQAKVDEIYDFTSLPNTLTNDSKFRLVFEHIYFTYSFAKTFSCKEAYLTTSDPCHLFTNLQNEEGKVKIPLKIQLLSKKYVVFSLNGNRYVNNQTLEMSNTPMDGYIKTSSFYLPLNKKEELKSYPFEIHVIDSGACKDHIVIPFIYEASSELFDGCITSDFCVHGGIKE